MRESKLAYVSPGKESADEVAARDRKIEVRRVRLVVMDGDPIRPWPPHVVARDGLYGIHRRLVVGSLDSDRDALARLKQAPCWHDRNAQLVDLAPFERLPLFMLPP